jgi:hypothetical protein
VPNLLGDYGGCVCPIIFKRNLLSKGVPESRTLVIEQTHAYFGFKKLQPTYNLSKRSWIQELVIEKTHAYFGFKKLQPTYNLSKRSWIQELVIVDSSLIWIKPQPISCVLIQECMNPWACNSRFKSGPALKLQPSHLFIYTYIYV